MTALQTQNDPASVRALPGHGSQHPTKDIEMNEATNTTAPAANPEHPWVKARRLLKELSITLQDCDDANWFAYVMPPKPQSFNGFGSYPMGPTADELAIDRVERLSWELSEVLKDYQGGSFQAMVLPSNVGGHTVMLTKISAFDRRASR